jgi:hypothetical protein
LRMLRCLRMVSGLRIGAARWLGRRRRGCVIGGRALLRSPVLAVVVPLDRPILGVGVPAGCEHTNSRAVGGRPRCIVTGTGGVVHSHAYDHWMNVVIATCAELPAGDADSSALVGALERRGVTARLQVWNDPALSWAGDLVIIRSTWDYTSDRDAFLAWARAVPRLQNPAEVIAWNSDKTYLRDLADAGVPVVPTAFVAPGEPARLPTAGEFVVKPSVGAGSMGAGRFDPDSAGAARTHVAALHDAGRTVLVQPYVSDVDTAGETALIYVDGRFSHAIRKAAMLPRQAANPLDRVSSGTLHAFEHITARAPASCRPGQAPTCSMPASTCCPPRTVPS